MIIWKGWGILVIPIALLGILLSSLVSSLFVSGDVLKSSAGNIIIGIGFLLSAIGIWFIGKWFHSRSQRIMIDRETGKEYNMGRTHSLFFIRMEYWSIVAVILGIAIFFTKN